MGLHAEKSATVHNCPHHRGVTHYEHDRGRRCISITEIMDDLLLEIQVRSWELQVRGRPRSGKNLGKVKVSEWWNVVSG